MNKDLKKVINEISNHAGMGRFQIFSPMGSFRSISEATPQPPTSQPPPQQPAAPAPKADVGQAKQDAAAASAEAQKAKQQADAAKAEKQKAEQEIEQSSGVKLTSKAGISFLFGKLLDEALKKNNIDALAAEFVDKLKVNTPEGFESFKNSTIMFANLKGYARLLQSIQTLISK